VLRSFAWMSARALAATQLYHELLSGAYAQRTHEQLAALIARQDLFFDGRPVCSVLRPKFLSVDAYERAMRQTALVKRGVMTTLDRVKQDAGLRKELRIPAHLELVFAFEPPCGTTMGRIDGFMPDDGPIKFIEYNPTPFGMAFGDKLANVFAALPIFQ